ncbi:putative component of the ESCRT-0 complex which is the sorting receptor for ubiquitinated cargo proteins at the multivesicular body (MVB) and recruits ESCRT-I to the MVB outer membrane [Lyophyllum shimeji]|uniref:Vacuolar protein sorting-associated protein 27 n=1 Tax=Lyophyllum shimeji TaxID=47721 RepID=A0A9P3UMF7_LYOSH|nr:putative component of the ESCRT-0 complex which is the sorting receptor for ubiquitinated cargo proteins at the multivesicular body (MVB) and recruits ESCRT-I to the MVB outer membrane [Lyophyllum shimeji]
MSGLGSWLWGTSQLDDAVDKATSELLPAGAEDIALNLEICDQIRSKSVPARDAMRALKRRLNHKNPNVQNLALILTDTCVKNGGDLFLTEVASREFMDNLVSILKIPGLNNDVKQHVLRLVQNWSIAFEGKPTLGYVGQVYQTLLGEGYNFPPKDLAVANSAMVDTQVAPEWIDSDVCLRCRTAFTFTNRKHHCRNCGQVFDQACSSKSLPLPHFGITQEVRVCEGCFNKLTRKADKTDRGHRHSASMHSTRHRSARELADAELQRAIQLSLQEASASNGHARPGYVPSQPSSWQASEPPIVDRSSHPTKPSFNEEEDDPDLRAAIEASLREANAPRPSAPIALESPRTEYTGPGYSQSYPPSVAQPLAHSAVPSYDLEPLESDAILTFSQTVEQVEAQGGRDISRYPAVNELYDKANSLRPKLALSLDDAGRKEQMLSDMHDKLSQAVKLYDKLLTEQLAHPRWRSPQPAATSYQPAETSYGTLNGYSQWASQMPATAAAYHAQPEPSQPPQSPQASYSSHSPQYAPSQPYAAPPRSQWHQQPAQPIQHSSPAPVVPAAPTFSPPQSPQAPQRRQSQYVEQQYQSYATPAPSHPQTLPPVTLNPQQYQAPATTSPLSFQAAPAPPAQTQSQYAASPPPPPPPQQQTQLQQQQQQQHAATDVPHSPNLNLNRHKSVSYAASPPPAPPVNGHVTRSNTVASHPPRQQQRQHQQPQQQVTPPSALPHFPVAPTSNPQTFPLYGPPITASLAPPQPPEERKEALLIDL